MEKDGQIAVCAVATPAGGCDFVMLGATGFLGSYILKAVEATGSKVIIAPRELRLHESRAELKAFLQACLPIKSGVICAAGTRGNPNIDWCTTHPGETIDANVVGQLNVCSVCRELSEEAVEPAAEKAEVEQNLIHVTLIGSGFAHNPSKSLDGSPIPDDSPCELFQGQHVYMRLRCLLEELLTAGAYTSTQVLNLRVVFPICRDLSDKRGLLGKLLNFSQIDRVANSCTFLEELCPLIPVMAARRVVGHMNFTNPGSVRYDGAATLMTDLLRERFAAAEASGATAHLGETPIPEAVRGYAPTFREPGGSGSRGALVLGVERLQEAVAPQVLRSADEALRETLLHAHF